MNRVTAYIVKIMSIAAVAVVCMFANTAMQVEPIGADTEAVTVTHEDDSPTVKTEIIRTYSTIDKH